MAGAITCLVFKPSQTHARSHNNSPEEIYKTECMCWLFLGVNPIKKKNNQLALPHTLGITTAASIYINKRNTPQHPPTPTPKKIKILSVNKL